MNIFYLSLFIFLSFITTSCNVSKNTSLKKIRTIHIKETEISGIETSTESGQYLAVLAPVNENITGEIKASATISKENDEFVADVRFSGNGLNAQTLHEQGIHEVKRCPKIEDDTNQDGIIDAVEGERVFGKVLIPLDADLSAQHLELGTYPYSDEFGNYLYSKFTSFKRLISDLRGIDLNPKDSLIKLSWNEDLNLGGRIVVIKGITGDANLPGTCQSGGRKNCSSTLPIACGVLKRVTTSPGEIVNDEGTSIDENGEPGGSFGSEDGAIINPPIEAYSFH